VDRKLGKVTVAANVLVTIVQKTASTMPGVAWLHDRVPNVKRLLGLHTVGPGVEISVIDGQVMADVYLVARRDFDLLQVGRQLQREVARAIQDIVGMEVGEVNIHIEDVATELSVDAEKATRGQASGKGQKE
jgi:uncharacterized alkaline shock family protein YloU